MKMKFTIPLLGMVLLSMLASCVDHIENVNPTYDPVTNTVNTRFVLNIAGGDDPATKQTAAVVQTDGNGFRGIEDATLYVFSLKDGSGQLANGKKVTDPTTESLGAYSLSKYLDAASMSGNRRIMDLPLPIGTNALIFYGMAYRGDQTPDKVGKMGYFPNENISKICSYPYPRLMEGSDEATYFYQLEEIVSRVVSLVLQTGINGTGETDKEEYDAVTTGTGTSAFTWNITGKPFHWADYSFADNGTDSKSPVYLLYQRLNPDPDHPTWVLNPVPTEAPTPAERILGKAWNAFTKMYPNELRAGSGEAVSTITRELANALDKAEDTSTDAGVDANLKNAIVAAIIGSINRYVSNFCSSTYAWKSIKDVVYTMNNTFHQTDLDFDGSPSTGTPKYTIQGFPGEFGVPEGSTSLKVDTLNSNRTDYAKYKVTLVNGNDVSIKFTYNDMVTAYDDVLIPVDPSDPDQVKRGVGIYDIIYPPELCYYGNSPIRTSVTNGLEESDFPNSTSGWSASSWGDKWTAANSSVTAATRGVAMAYNIQYGMALMQTQIRYYSGSPTLIDNAIDLAGAQKNNEFPLTSSSAGLALKGILIGGQPSVVNWQYLPWRRFVEDSGLPTRSDGGTVDYPHKFSFNKMIYDREMNVKNGVSASVIPIGDGGALSVPNYTVVYDNYDTDGEQNTVYVALEFQNNLGSFYGYSGVIPNGGTFYLLGKLIPTQAQGTDPFPGADDAEGNMLAPYDDDGYTIAAKRVFIADHTTKAIFTINQDALQKAFLSVPDLRSTSLSLGLSVDIEWVDGYTFNVDLGTPTNTGGNGGNSGNSGNGGNSGTGGN